MRFGVSSLWFNVSEAVADPTVPVWVIKLVVVVPVETNSLLNLLS